MVIGLNRKWLNVECESTKKKIHKLYVIPCLHFVRSSKSCRLYKQTCFDLGNATELNLIKDFFEVKREKRAKVTGAAGIRTGTQKKEIIKKNKYNVFVPVSMSMLQMFLYVESS